MEATSKVASMGNISGLTARRGGHLKGGRHVGEINSPADFLEREFACWRMICFNFSVTVRGGLV
jgi:hypothetical protein